MLRRRIDVHRHIVPPAYADWLASQGVSDAGGRELPAWSADEALTLMERHDIATAVVSVSTPGVHLRPGAEHDAVARAKAREVNEFAARLARDHADGHAAVDRRNVEALLPSLAHKEIA